MKNKSYTLLLGIFWARFDSVYIVKWFKYLMQCKILELVLSGKYAIKRGHSQYRSFRLV